MAEKFEYTGIVQVPDTLPNALEDIWERSMLAERERIKSSIDQQLPDEANYLTKLADASSDVWASFISTTWPNKDVIIMKQRVKLAAAWDAYHDGVAAAFAVGGAFATQVPLKAPKYQSARRTIAGVGFKPYGGWKPVSKGALLFTGDSRPERYMTGGVDTFTGAAYSAIDTTIAPYAKPTLIAMLIEGLVMAIIANEAGLNADRDTIITNTNTKVAGYVTKVKRTGVDAATLEIQFAGGVFKIYAHVTTT